MITKFSVIIPLYNKENDIALTIKSVLNQSFTDFEIMVVDDGSTDNSLEIVKKFKDNRLRIFKIHKTGVSFARNFGVEKSNGSYLAFLDADDFWYPNHLENLAQLISKYSHGEWFATAYEIQHNKRLILPMKAPPMLQNGSWIGEIDDFFINSMEDSLAWTSAVAFRRDFFLKIGGFNELFDTGQDMDLWIRSALERPLFFSTVISARYNLLGSNRITNHPTHLKRHMDMDQFKEQEEKYLSFKKYMDRIRYSYVVKFRIANMPQVWRKILIDIDPNNLTKLQRFILSSDKRIIIVMYFIKSVLEQFKIRIRTT